MVLRVPSNTFERLIERLQIYKISFCNYYPEWSLRQNSRLAERKRQIQRRVKLISLNKYSEPVRDNISFAGIYLIIFWNSINILAHLYDHFA